MYRLIYIACTFVFIFPLFSTAQDIELLEQLEGRYSYLAFGNTLNLSENTGDGSICDILEETIANFNLTQDQQLISAHLYWAGSGQGDFEVKLNDIEITAERTFSFLLDDSVHFYAGGYANVTDQLLATGNGDYTFSEFTPDINATNYCTFPGNTTNFGGWAITAIYEDPTLPLNQVSLFDGFETVSAVNSSLDIVLTELDVVDNAEAKVGFLAWEGDKSLDINETLRLNGVILSNEPLNPANNAFNGTNTFTGSDTLYNMDIDVYSIEDLIQPGDETALIQLTSGRDLVIIQNIATVLNIALPDATIAMDTIVGGTECDNREISIDYTVFNTNGTDRLPITSIGFYANNTLIEQTSTQDVINFGESETGSITITVPENIPADFLLRAFVDDEFEFNELDDDNNEDNIEFHLLVSPNTDGLTNLELCDVVGIELFDLTEATQSIDSEKILTYHTSETDAQNNENPITENIENYEIDSNMETIWIRVDNSDCVVVESFTLEIIICPLPDATVTTDNEIFACRQRDLVIEYTIYNTNGTAPLPANTPMAFYADNVLLAQAQTLATINEGESEMGSLEITLPDTLPDSFNFRAVVDDNGTGAGIIEELDETNNIFENNTDFGTIDPIPSLPDLLECDLGFDTATFDLTEQDDLISIAPTDTISYYTNMDDAISNENAIEDPEQFENTSDPQTIFVRKENEICFALSSFLLTTENCPPIIYEGTSPNGDNSNDVFVIEGLINVYENFVLKIYSRQGNLIYEGGNDDGLWNGIPNTGILLQNKVVPVGTYYYSLQLNDPSFPDPFLGDLYVNY